MSCRSRSTPIVTCRPRSHETRSKMLRTEARLRDTGSSSTWPRSRRELGKRPRAPRARRIAHGENFFEQGRDTRRRIAREGRSVVHETAGMKNQKGGAHHQRLLSLRPQSGARRRRLLCALPDGLRQGERLPRNWRSTFANQRLRRVSARGSVELRYLRTPSNGRLRRQSAGGPRHQRDSFPADEAGRIVKLTSSAWLGSSARS
jgi:hypothetical protein